MVLSVEGVCKSGSWTGFSVKSARTPVRNGAPRNGGQCFQITYGKNFYETAKNPGTKSVTFCNSTMRITLILLYANASLTMNPCK